MARKDWRKDHRRTVTPLRAVALRCAGRPLSRGGRERSEPNETGDGERQPARPEAADVRHDGCGPWEKGLMLGER